MRRTMPPSPKPMSRSPTRPTGVRRSRRKKGSSKWRDSTISSCARRGFTDRCERDYFLMAKSIGQHIDFSVGYRRQIITFIYVKDLVNAALLALTKGNRAKRLASPTAENMPRAPSPTSYKEDMGVRHVAHICAPLWVLHAVCALSGTWARLRGKTTTLNLDKYRIMKQRNWRCDISRARKELSYEPQYDLSAASQKQLHGIKAKHGFKLHQFRAAPARDCSVWRKSHWPTRFSQRPSSVWCGAT